MSDFSENATDKDLFLELKTFKEELSKLFKVKFFVETSKDFCWVLFYFL